MSPSDMKGAAGLGVGSVRNTMTWRVLQPEPAELEIPRTQQALELAAERQGIDLLTPISYGNPHFEEGSYPVSEGAVGQFTRAAAFAALVLRNPQPVFEIWNEWNLGIGMGDAGKGDPEDYVRLLASVYPAMKSVRNPPKILGGVMAGAGLTDDWTLRACRAGMLGHLDGLSFHPYSFWMMGRKVMPERGMLDLVAALEKTIAPFERGGDVPLYITEIGWPTFDGSEGVTLDEQAQFAARTLFLLRANPRVRGVWWFNLRDKDSNSSDFNHRFGLLFSDGSPKPSYFAFRDTVGELHGIESARHERLGRDGHAVWMECSGGRRKLAVWIARPGGQARLTISEAGNHDIPCRLMGAGRDFSLPTVAGKLSVSVGNMPLVMTFHDSTPGIENHAVLEPTP